MYYGALCILVLACFQHIPYRVRLSATNIRQLPSDMQFRTKYETIKVALIGGEALQQGGHGRPRRPQGVQIH